MTKTKDPVIAPEPPAAEISPSEVYETLTISDWLALSKSLGYNLSDKDDLLKRVDQLSRLYLMPLGSIVIEPALLTRIRTRYTSADKTKFNEWFHKLVVKLLHDYVGW